MITRSPLAKRALGLPVKVVDPLLKSADELVGKLRPLAESDFKPTQRITPHEKGIFNHDFGSLVFLFGKFWAQVEIIRQEGMSVAMAKDERGLQLQSFFDCLESRRVQIIERILQWAAGEAFLERVHDPNPDNSSAVEI